MRYNLTEGEGDIDGKDEVAGVNIDDISIISYAVDYPCDKMQFIVY